MILTPTYAAASLVTALARGNEPAPQPQPGSGVPKVDITGFSIEGGVGRGIAILILIAGLGMVFGGVVAQFKHGNKGDTKGGAKVLTASIPGLVLIFIGAAVGITALVGLLGDVAVGS